MTIRPDAELEDLEYWYLEACDAGTGGAFLKAAIRQFQRYEDELIQLAVGHAIMELAVLAASGDLTYRDLTPEHVAWLDIRSLIKSGRFVSPQPAAYP